VLIENLKLPFFKEFRITVPLPDTFGFLPVSAQKQNVTKYIQKLPLTIRPTEQWITKSISKPVEHTPLRTLTKSSVGAAETPFSKNSQERPADTEFPLRLDVFESLPSWVSSFEKKLSNFDSEFIKLQYGVGSLFSAINFQTKLSCLLRPSTSSRFIVSENIACIQYGPSQFLFFDLKMLLMGKHIYEFLESKREVQVALLNKSGTKLALVNRSSVSVMDVPPLKNQVTTVTLQREATCNSAAPVDYKWHPSTLFLTHLLILWSDNYLRIYNSEYFNGGDELYMESEISLSLESTPTLSRNRVVSFDIPPEGKGWSRLAVYVLTLEGRVYVLCPVVPFSALTKSGWDSIAEEVKLQQENGLDSLVIRKWLNSLLEIIGPLGGQEDSSLKKRWFESYKPVLQGPLHLVKPTRT
jgi:hypothetical protein